MKSFRGPSLILPVVGLVMGFYLLLRPWSATEALCALIGWLFLLAGAAGILNAVAFQRTTLMSDPLLPVSVVGIVVGVFFITRPYTLMQIVGLIVCVLLVLQGVFGIQHAEQRRRWGESTWWVSMAVGVVSVVLGLVALFAPGTSTTLMMRLIGVMLICSGALELAGQLFHRG